MRSVFVLEEIIVKVRLTWIPNNPMEPYDNSETMTVEAESTIKAMLEFIEMLGKGPAPAFLSAREVL